MQFITDRTHADVLLGNEKGIYSYEDLNRVERAVAQLSAMGSSSLPVSVRVMVVLLPPMFE